MSPYTISVCSFLCTDLLTCILLCSFYCNLILVFQKQSPLQNSCTCIPPQFSLVVVKYLYSCFLNCHHSHPFFTHRQKKVIFKEQEITKLQCQQNIQPERNYYFLLSHPSFRFPLPDLWLELPPLLHLSFSSFASLSPYSLVSPSPLSWTLATTIASHWNPDPLCQPASPMPPRSSAHPSSIHSTYSGPPTSSKSLPFTLHLSVALLSSLLTSRSFLPWLLTSRPFLP